MPKRSIYVVKFGGSLLSSDSLYLWVDALSTWAEDKSVVVVPGGGEYADAVRTAQRAHGFDDKYAHIRALEAMGRTGSRLSAIVGNSLKACSLNQLVQTKLAGKFQLWFPSAEEFRASGMAEDWSVTSDSIALWLAGYLEARDLVLLKMAPPPSPEPVLWSGSQYVDAYFSTLLAKVQCKVTAVYDYRDLKLKKAGTRAGTGQCGAS